MEGIKDIIDFFKSRIGNPFFISFLVSWLIINWEIPVALLFFNNEQLKLEGCNSYVDFINNYLNSVNNKPFFWSKLLSIPIYSTLFISFIIPSFKKLLYDVYYTKINVISNNWQFKIENKKIIEENEKLVEENLKLKT